MSSMVCVTAFCDASFCHQTKAAAWGVWIKGPLGTFNKAYNFKLPMHTATEAERCAAVNTLAIIKKMYAAYPAVTIILQSDCLAVRAVFDNSNIKVTAGSIRPKTMRRHFKNMPTGWKLTIKHVKAHTGLSDPRSWVNDLIDKQAKELMRKKRQKIKKKGETSSEG